MTGYVSILIFTIMNNDNIHSLYKYIYIYYNSLTSPHLSHLNTSPALLF